MNSGNYCQQLEYVERRDQLQKESDRQIAIQIGRYLGRQRRQQSLKLRHVAERTGLSISRVFAIESGKGKLVDVKTFRSILAAVKSNPDSDE
jgi:hypothetical protein